jgi:hypothetical protein
VAISLSEEDITMEATALQAGGKIPVLAEWRGSREKRQSEASMPDMPVWLKRSQKQGLSPYALERYLESGWPISSIARDRNLEVWDIEQCLARWFHEA